MLKITVTLIVIFGCLQSCLASPVVDPYKFNEVKSPTEKISNEIEETFKSISKSVPWAAQSLSQLSSNILREAGIGYLSYCLSVLLRFEVFAMASGTHFILPEMVSSELEKEHRIIAIATYKLTLKLHAVQQLDSILTKVSEETAKEIYVAGDVTLIDKSMKILCEKLETRIKGNHNLYSDYITEKREAEKESYPPIGKRIFELGKSIIIDPKKLEEALSLPTLRTWFLTKTFLITGEKHISLLFDVDEFDRFLTARWMLGKTTSLPDYGKLETVYKDAVLKAVTEATPQSSVYDVSDILFKKLTQLIEVESKWKIDFEQYKTIEKKIINFDSSFLRVHILPF